MCAKVVILTTSARKIYILTTFVRKSHHFDEISGNHPEKLQKFLAGFLAEFLGFLAGILAAILVQKPFR